MPMTAALLWLYNESKTKKGMGSISAYNFMQFLCIRGGRTVLVRGERTGGQADTMTAAPQLAVQTVSLEQTALQIRINATLRIFLAAVAVILAAGSQSARYFPKLRQIHTGDSREIICYIHKTDGKKKNASM